MASLRQELPLRNLQEPESLSRRRANAGLSDPLLYGYMEDR